MDWVLKLTSTLIGSHDRGAISPKEAECSVAVPIGFHEDRKRAEIVLTKRTMLVESHKGQVSFPGGLHESHDEDLLAMHNFVSAKRRLARGPLTCRCWAV